MNPVGALSAATLALPIDESARVIARLIEVCKEAEHAFRAACDEVTTPACRTLFCMYAEQRAQFVGELETISARLGRSETRMTATAHGRWAELKARFPSRRTLIKVLEQMTRGEEAAERAYDEALGHPLEPAIETIVRRQHQAIVSALQNVRSLRDTSRCG